jgi:hypothetical protein
MKRALFVLVALASLAAPAHAQAVVTTNSTLIWTAPSNSANAAEAQGFEYRFRDNNGAFIAVPGVVCTSLVADGCTAKLTAPMVTILNAIGTHNITLSAYAASVGLESGQSVPFVLKTPAAAPTSLKLTP